MDGKDSKAKAFKKEEEMAVNICEDLFARGTPVRCTSHLIFPLSQERLRVLTVKHAQ